MRYISLLLITIFLLCSCFEENHSPVSIQLSAFQDQTTVSVSSEFPASQSTEGQRHFLDSIFHHFYSAGMFNGNVLVLQSDSIVFSGTYGYGNLTDLDTLQLDFPFQLASVSKMFTSYAIMLLVQDSLIALDNEVKSYIPDFPYEDITVRHLLTHRSGLPRYESLAHEFWADKGVFVSNDTLLHLFKTYNPILYFSPGSRFNYINTNYYFLSLLVERLSGRSFQQFMKERVFTPLSMNNTFIYSATDCYLLPEKVLGYRCGNRPSEIPNDYLNGVTGDKGVYASAIDLGKFDRELRENKLLEKRWVDTMFTPSGTYYKKGRDDYGFGWRLKPGNTPFIYHFGWWKGFRTAFIRQPETKRSIIVLGNCERTFNYRIFFDVLNNWDNLPVQKSMMLKQIAEVHDYH